MNPKYDKILMLIFGLLKIVCQEAGGLRMEFVIIFLIKKYSWPQAKNMNKVSELHDNIIAECSNSCKYDAVFLLAFNLV